MRLYKFDEIKAAITAERAAVELLNLDVRAGRCAATWRGGDNPTSVSFDNETYYDHVAKDGGSVIDLVALVKFGDKTRIIDAQMMLGEFLGLPYIERQPDPSTRYSKLLDKGYKETTRYRYTDEVGNLVMQVVRLEHPTFPKEFLQCDSAGKWSVKHLEPVLYNLPGIVHAQSVFICEGEKDADRLTMEGCAATTNAGGAENWSAAFAKQLAGKDVAIIADNDEAGIKHARIVAASIINDANTVWVIHASQRPKGDVSDFFDDGGTVQTLFSMVSTATPLTPADLEGVDLPKERDAAIEDAKQANRYPFRNFTTQKVQTVGAGGKAKVSEEKRPKHETALIDEIHRRFLNFPRKVGEQLFDHDRDSGRIVYFRKSTTLFSWIARKSRLNVDWSRGDAFTSKDQLYEGISAEAQRYESISSVPDWPTRDDVYYAHDPLPPPDPDLKYFEKLVSFFNPAPGFEIPLRAFIIAPLLYHPGWPRPLWVIESDQPGSGKTTLANTVSQLYGHPPIEVKKREFAKDMQKITERLVSRSGRLARMLLVDNVTGTFSSEELSGLITMPFISGKAPYGHGEENRPNNLTYVITANSASIDNDLAIRAYWVKINKVDYSTNWATDLSEFIDKHRLNIFADVLSLISNHEPFPGIAPITRCPQFETMILQAVCGGEIGRYNDAIKLMVSSRSEANIEEDQGKQVEDEFRAYIADAGINPEDHSVWLHNAVVDEWVKRSFPSTRMPTQFIRNLAKTGHCSRIDSKLQAYPHHGDKRRRGLLWLNAEGCRKPSRTLTMINQKVKPYD